jgi:hypothetical protein
MKKFLLLILLVCSFQLLLATTITSIKCSNWTDTSTWDLNRIPIASDTIVIDSFVYFDTDFTSESPGMLIVNSGGSLCGNQTYTGQFLNNGFCYLYTIILNYGQSESNQFLNIKQLMTVENGASYSTNRAMCVGCSYSCENCTATIIEQVDSTEINNELNQTKIDSLNSISVNFLATHFSNIDISIFPNPSALFFNIAGITQNTSISLYNNLGKLLFKTAAENDVLINTEGLSNGTYTLLLERDFFKQYKKIVVLN